MLPSKAALEGERKQVTVLFADLKGSMELLADRDPEEARKILDPSPRFAARANSGPCSEKGGEGRRAMGMLQVDLRVTIRLKSLLAFFRRMPPQ
jgi:class 3 adenylate cyclase